MGTVDCDFVMWQDDSGGCDGDRYRIIIDEIFTFGCVSFHFSSSLFWKEAQCGDDEGHVRLILMIIW